MEKQAPENFVHLVEEDRHGKRAKEAEHKKQINKLLAEAGRLIAQLVWLKKSGFRLEYI